MASEPSTEPKPLAGDTATHGLEALDTQFLPAVTTMLSVPPSGPMAMVSLSRDIPMFESATSSSLHDASREANSPRPNVILLIYFIFLRLLVYFHFQFSMSKASHPRISCVLS